MNEITIKPKVLVNNYVYFQYGYDNINRSVGKVMGYSILFIGEAHRLEYVIEGYEATVPEHNILGIAEINPFPKDTQE